MENTKQKAHHGGGMATSMMGSLNEFNKRCVLRQAGKNYLTFA